jgi:hypothetical protein
MVRYNAAHRGAEEEVFPHTAMADPPGVVAYTATRWGALLDPALTPAGEPTPRGSDCYRFALTRSEVDVVIAGPKNGAELDEARPRSIAGRCRPTSSRGCGAWATR